MKRTLWLVVTLVLGASAVVACSDDTTENVAVASGVLGSRCSCDSDCDSYGDWATACYKGICMVQPQGDCSSPQACPEGTVCVDLPSGDETFPVCALSCDDPDLTCHGQCDPSGACLPGPEDNCFLGCCTAADPPFGGVEDPYPDETWDPPTCGAEPGATYPCPPYGSRPSRVIPNLAFMPANAEARAVAGSDGIFTMSDVYQAKPKLVILFGSAKW